MRRRGLGDATRTVQDGVMESLAVLVVSAGGVELGIPLASVREVLPQLPTRMLPFGPPYLREMFDWGDRPVCVLDLAVALGVPKKSAFQDRRLVVLVHEDTPLALSVDAVHDPEEISPSDVTPRRLLGGAGHAHLADVLCAVIRRARGSLAVVDPTAFLSDELFAEIRGIFAPPADGPSLSGGGA